MDLKRRIKRFLRMSKPGMRGRIILGFVLLVLILSLSSIIAVFEYRRMSNYVSGMIAENIKCINTAHKLLSSCDNYNMTLLTAISDDSVETLPAFDQEQFSEDYGYLRQAVTGRSAMMMVDSVRYAYSAYLLVAGEMEQVWLADFSDSNTRDWYFNRLQADQFGSLAGKFLPEHNARHDCRNGGHTHIVPFHVFHNIPLCDPCQEDAFQHT